MAVGELVAARDGLLTADRMDARILELVDGLSTAADAALAAGRLGAVDACLTGIGAAATVRADPGQRHDCAGCRQRERANALAGEADALLRRRELAAAEACESALQFWSTAGCVDSKLQQIREQE
jgi:hypothetical protein